MSLDDQCPYCNGPLKFEKSKITFGLFTTSRVCQRCGRVIDHAVQKHPPEKECSMMESCYDTYLQPAIAIHCPLCFNKLRYLKSVVDNAYSDVTTRCEKDDSYWLIRIHPPVEHIEVLRIRHPDQTYEDAMKKKT